MADSVLGNIIKNFIYKITSFNFHFNSLRKEKGEPLFKSK